MTQNFLLKRILRRGTIWGSAGTLGYGTYKAKTDPPHLFWDLDHTILCSVSPIPNGESLKWNETSPDENALEYFDQIDDDFPFDPVEQHPNTRTFWRPGARGALWICSWFSIQHVYTAAQESYTNNILKQLDPNYTLFTSITHRDNRPAIVSKGKDLSKCKYLIPSERIEPLLKRSLLFDDRVRNFDPQEGNNGIHVKAFHKAEHDKDMNQSAIFANAKQYCEMGRLVSAALMALLVEDVRHWITPFFASNEHKKRFSDIEED